ncbi:MAG: nitroreductase family protein [Rikenellaceae bacterium]
MKRGIYVALVAFVMVSVGCVSAQKSSGGMDAIEAIMTRSSVRSYTSQPVEAEKVEIMLRAAMAAPTGMNRQPWAYYVVESREKLDEIASRISGAKMAATAQLGIVVCGDLEQGGENSSPDFWVVDAAASTENMLIAANSLGLGTVWTGGYPNMERVNALREILSIPSNLIPLCFVPVGYPDSEPKIKDKWKPERIHYVK